MLKRTITGACFCAVIISFFLFREYVDYRIFQFLTAFLCAAATFEVARAVKPFSAKGSFYVQAFYGITVIPLYCVFDYFVDGVKGYPVALIYCLLFLCINALLVCFSKREKTDEVFSENNDANAAKEGVPHGKTIALFNKKSDLTYAVTSVFPVLYPSVLVFCMAAANDLAAPKGFLALLTIFVVSCLTDTMAYLVGMTYSKIRKGKAKKMCPVLSPNKTIAGGIGGIIGGIVGGIIVFYVFYGKATEINFFSPLLLFIIVGFAAAILTQAGDLFESYIKRKAGIKDMGKIMPGHGGIMDRIDGISFASVAVFITFALV